MNLVNKKRIILFISLTIVMLIIYFLFIKKELYYKNPSIQKHVKLLTENKEQFVQIEKSKIYYQDSMTQNYKQLTNDDLKDIRTKLRKYQKNMKKIYKIGKKHLESGDVMAFEGIFNTLKINNQSVIDNSSPYIFLEDDFEIVEWDNFNNFFIKDITGHLPINQNEILISNYLADNIISRGIKLFNEEEDYYPNNHQDIITSYKDYYFCENKIKIVGIINYDLSKYQELKSLSWEQFNKEHDKYFGIYENFTYKKKNIYNKIFVNKEFIKKLQLNDFKEDAIWENKVINSGLLVIENREKEFKRILRKFKITDSITLKSTYSEQVDTF